VSEQAQKLVILVEDEDDIARLIMHHLTKAGFRVRRPERAPDLISEAEKERPALLILDLMLPEMDGFQLCRAVRAHPTLRDVPILVLTARTGAEDRRRALESGANQYATKPFKPSALIETVRSLSQG
jgi:DNA-binding response OmpR family regulator